MFKEHNFKIVPGTEQIDLGRGLEKKEADILDKIGAIGDYPANLLIKAYDFLRRNSVHEEKIEQALREVDFDHVLLLIKKVVRNSALATGNSFQDFAFSHESVDIDNQMKAGGVAWSSINRLAINPAKISKAAMTFDLNEEDLKLNAAHVVIHEVLHLLGAKEEDQTGFTSEKENEALNEAMTDLLARTLTRAYKDFRNTAEGDRLLLSAYDSEIDCLLALMVLIAKDNQVEVESVIQAFTTSYFYDDSVVSALSYFATIGPEAERLVFALQQGSFKRKFNIDSLNLDEGSKRLFNSLQENKDIMLKALHL